MALHVAGKADLPALPIQRSVAELRRQVADWRRAGETIGLVPTMGALHDGHLALAHRARRDCTRIIASLFVNPLQFNATDDFRSYPRDEADDHRMLASAGVDLLFAPPVDEVYPPGFDTSVSVGALARPLCGATRPGHFQGVATVVTKLLLLTLPDYAFFGEKDYQQLLVIHRLALDLNFPVEIVGVPTVREQDGLAMSSRNRHLSPTERATASIIPRLLGNLADDIARGGDIAEALISGRTALFEAGIDRVDYLDCCDGATLEPVRVLKPGARLFVACYVGKTRLIDNLAIPA
ncbi:MAG: pantoate--beta-alanine ligase [Rhodospirillaceae bacterium]|nr:pantoate--beta-alanine ligase [Rhodospirillaceae bacterium]